MGGFWVIKELSIAALAITLICPASGQSSTTYNAQNVFNEAAKLYTRDDSLGPGGATLYDLLVPSNFTSPDLLLTVNSTSNGTGLGLYCSRRGVQPAPGYALWTSDMSTTSNQIFISKNDLYYSQIIQPISDTPALTCSVRNFDQNETNNFTFTMSVISDNRTLVASEQVVLANLYSRCCARTGSCNAWKALTNAQSGDANGVAGGMVRTDFCSFPGQICSPSANLYRLDLSGFNMTCNWPHDLFGQLSQLATLLVPDNNFTGNTTSLGKTFTNLKSLQLFDGTGNTELSGDFNSGEAQDGICSAAQNTLVTLRLTDMNISGTIPECLYSAGSKIIILRLGQNRFSGSLSDTIPSDTNLQSLILTDNQLSGSIPASLGNAVRLTEFSINNNQFTGSIPESIGSIGALVTFSAVNNQLTGAIPDSFGTAKNIELFDVKQNQLTSLPAAWNDVSFDAVNTSFVTIRASMNQISGPFPTGLAFIPNLQLLVLNENNLTGPLPTNNSMFPSLRAVNISVNQLTGEIPEQFNQSALFGRNALIMLNGQPLQQVFDVSWNRLTGLLPEFMAKDKLPPWVINGINLQGNDFSVSCLDGSYNYITSICPEGARSTGNQQYPPTPPGFSSAGDTAMGVTASNDRPFHHSPPPSGLSPGAIAGIVVGSVVGVALVAAVAGYLVYRRRNSGVGIGELGRSISLNKGLTHKGSNTSTMSDSGIGKFHAFVDEEGQKSIELSPSKELPTI